MRLGFGVAPQLPKPLDELVPPCCRQLGTSTMTPRTQYDHLLEDRDGLVHVPAPKQHLVELLARLGSQLDRAARPRALPRVSQRGLGTFRIECDDVAPALPELLFGTAARQQA